MGDHNGPGHDRNLGWRSKLAVWAAGFLVFETLTGLSIWVLPFNVPNQVLVIFHTLLGLLFILPVTWYVVRHWLYYRSHLTTHVKIFGYVGAGAAALCGVSGLILTWQAVFGVIISYTWDLIHVITTLALIVFVVPHVVMIVTRALKHRHLPEMEGLIRAARHYGAGTALAGIGLLALEGCTVLSVILGKVS